MVKPTPVICECTSAWHHGCLVRFPTDLRSITANVRTVSHCFEPCVIASVMGIPEPPSWECAKDHHRCSHTVFLLSSRTSGGLRSPLVGWSVPSRSLAMPVAIPWDRRPWSMTLWPVCAQGKPVSPGSRFRATCNSSGVHEISNNATQ